jgi:hypothetical protein
MRIPLLYPGAYATWFSSIEEYTPYDHAFDVARGITREEAQECGLESSKYALTDVEKKGGLDFLNQRLLKKKKSKE